MKNATTKIKVKISELKKEIEENKYICNVCHEHYPANEMDFDEENESDICKNCNYVSYNDAPYGEI